MKPPSTQAVILLIVLLLVASTAQALLAHRLHWLGGQPDFVLTTVLVAALLSNAGTGSVLGFFAGLLTAALAGQTVGTFLVTRTLGGFVAGWFSERMFRGNIAVIMIGVLCATAVSEVLYVLAVPRIGAGLWLRGALVGACWNALLAVPTTQVLHWLGWGQEDY